MSSASRIIVIVTTLTILGLVGFAYGTSELQDTESHFTDFEVNNEYADNDQVPALSTRHKRQATFQRCKSQCIGLVMLRRVRRPPLRFGQRFRQNLVSRYFACTRRCEVTCETLPSSIPNAAQVVITGNRLGAIANYECDTGYVLEGGPSPRTCLQDGKWTGTAVTCGSVCRVVDGTISPFCIGK